ncbi:hypothetical protein BDD43_0387 [Mucilaginibacter gracilis]|uniref:Uncharacterized protein n=1 Tax=Mucilaginibacter gracilis TaxID=423350 RepID=A0A495IVF8_9SPHI|nr:hypothetical protein [Mucilaginibacter gracilis]RKR80291.1 hypothetical protein BDD43_0387 [Mucilaginibacter gracilis]
MNKLLRLILSMALLTAGYAAQGQDTVKKIQKAAYPPVKAQIPVAKPTYHAKYLDKVTPPPVVDNSLTGQYNAILKSTYRYQQEPIIAFYKNYMDTLNLAKRKLQQANTKISEQATAIASIQGAVTTKDQTLSDSISKADSIGFLGASVSKVVYNIIMWGLVIILALSLATVIYLSASNKREAAYRIKLYEELSAEFAAYKTKANDKEKKLARELQTERNKLAELLNK